MHERPPENKIENQDSFENNFKDIQEVFRLNPELKEIANDIFTGITIRDIILNIEPFGKSIDNIEVLSEDKKIGYVQVSKNNSTKTLIVSGIELKEKGNGKKVYLKLQEQYPDFVIKSDSKNISEDAIFMWDSLVKRDLAIKTQDKEYSIKNPKQGILNLYNSYLKNIFPESKYNDIGFKGVPQDFYEENKPSFYTKDIEAAKYYSGLREGTQTISAIFNFKNPLVVNAEKPAPIPIITPDGKILGTFNDKDINEKIISAGYDGLILNRKFSTPLDGWEILSFDNNSRHILGSKQDIDNFKKWKEESEDISDNKALKNKYSQEIIDYVWKRLAKEGIANADNLIGTRDSIENKDFKKFWDAVKDEDIKNLISAYQQYKTQQLKNFEAYKDKYGEGGFVPELGEMISQDTSWWDTKISDLNSLLK